MNNHQCVPSWDLDENPITPRTLDYYEVAELTWENGQPAMHGLSHPKAPNGFPKGPSTHVYTKYNNSGSGSSGGGGGTLESIVNQATTTPRRKLIGSGGGGGGNELLSWFVPPSASGEAMDALVPCTNNTNNINPILDSRVGGSSTRVDSCSGGRNVRLARVTAADLASHDWSSRVEYSVSNSGTCGKEYSRQLTRDTCTVGFTSTSVGSQENTSSGMQHTYKTGDDDHDDSVCHGATHQSERGEGSKMKGTGKGSVSTKRSRAAAIHNQSERKRRDKINQRMKTLQKMVPNSNKTDKASMLDEVIEYLKQLQAQINMVSRMNLPQMMLPLAMQQQQLQMSMMGMGLPGLGVGMGLMEMNTMGRNNINGMPPVLHPNAFMQTAVAPWDGTGDRMPSAATPTIHDPLAAFLASQSQPMTMDAYTRMAALFQQFYQHWSF